MNLDCGIPNDEGFSLGNVHENDAIGISRRIHITCSAGYSKKGSEILVCGPDGIWKANLKCTNKRKTVSPFIYQFYKIYLRYIYIMNKLLY